VILCVMHHYNMLFHLTMTSLLAVSVHAQYPFTVDTTPFFTYNHGSRQSSVTIDNVNEVLCQHVPDGAIGIQVRMGNVRDHFRPTRGNSMCQMLSSTTHHQFFTGSDWVLPRPAHVHDVYSRHKHLGGSSEGWPTQYLVNDSRTTLSFWGNSNGGCCSSNYNTSSDWLIGYDFLIPTLPPWFPHPLVKRAPQQCIPLMLQRLYQHYFQPYHHHPHPHLLSEYQWT
jgi:hypothetical protein